MGKWDLLDGFDLVTRAGESVFRVRPELLAAGGAAVEEAVEEGFPPGSELKYGDGGWVVVLPYDEETGPGEPEVVLEERRLPPAPGYEWAERRGRPVLRLRDGGASPRPALHPPGAGWRWRPDDELGWVLVPPPGVGPAEPDPRSVPAAPPVPAPAAAAPPAAAPAARPAAGAPPAAAPASPPAPAPLDPPAAAPPAPPLSRPPAPLATDRLAVPAPASRPVNLSPVPAPAKPAQPPAQPAAPPADEAPAAEPPAHAKVRRPFGLLDVAGLALIIGGIVLGGVLLLGGGGTSVPAGLDEIGDALGVPSDQLLAAFNAHEPGEVLTDTPPANDPLAEITASALVLIDLTADEAERLGEAAAGRAAPGRQLVLLMELAGDSPPPGTRYRYTFFDASGTSLVPGDGGPVVPANLYRSYLFDEAAGTVASLDAAGRVGTVGTAFALREGPFVAIGVARDELAGTSVFGQAAAVRTGGPSVYTTTPPYQFG